MKPDKIAKLLGISIDAVHNYLNTSPPEEVTALDQAKRAFNAAPSDSKPQRLAFEKWLSLCATAEQTEEAFNTTSCGSKSERLAFKKWINLCTTTTQLEKAYYVTPLLR